MIILPAGSGKSFIASVLAFNYRQAHNKYFVIVTSQQYLVEQLKKQLGLAIQMLVVITME